MTPLLERRYVTGEFRADGETPQLIGHAAVFNQRSEDLGGFQEQIAPGAFRAAIAEDDVRALWNHDSNYVLGRNRAGTLQLAEDEVGLATSITIPDTTWARDLLVSIRRGDVTQMSFGFYVDDQGSPGDTWHEENGVYIRTLLKVRLFDVSPVTYPAYPQTDVVVRKQVLERGRRALQPAEPGERGDIDHYRRRARLAAAMTVTEASVR